MPIDWNIAVWRDPFLWLLVGSVCGVLLHWFVYRYLGTEPQSLSQPSMTTKNKGSIIQTVEAEIDAEGRVRLLGELRIIGRRRALVTVLDEPAVGSKESATTGGVVS